MSNMDKSSIVEYSVWLEKININNDASTKIITKIILDDFHEKKAQLEEEYGVLYPIKIPKSYVGEHLYNWTQSEIRKMKKILPLMEHGREIFKNKLNIDEYYSNYFHEKISKNILRYFFLDSVIKKHFEPYVIRSYSLKYNTAIVLFQLSVIFDFVYENNIPIRLRNEKAFKQLKVFERYDSDEKINFLILVCNQIEKKRREDNLLERLNQENTVKIEKKKKI